MKLDSFINSDSFERKENVSPEVLKLKMYIELWWKSKILGKMISSQMNSSNNPRCHGAQVI